MSLVQEWVRQNKFDHSILPDVYDRLYFEGDLWLRKLTNYAVMLLLATIISTYGITSDSTATVVGAMLVAPLMTPIMGTTLALVMGNGRRATISFIMVVVSVGIVIGLAAVMSFPFTFLNFDENGEIASRVAPGLPAMLVALAAGAAGAFAFSRKSVGESLPGVAIAISLVPPLSVVGIALIHGELDDAYGAFLLFVTNFLSIILAGSLVFWLGGANTQKLSESQATARTRAYAVAIVSSFLVLALLASTSLQAYRNSRYTNVAEGVTLEWLGGSDYELIDLSVRRSDVSVTVAGQGELAPVEQLATNLSAELNTDIRVLVRRLLREKQQFPEAQAP